MIDVTIQLLNWFTQFKLTIPLISLYVCLRSNLSFFLSLSLSLSLPLLSLSFFLLLSVYVSLSFSLAFSLILPLLSISLFPPISIFLSSSFSLLYISPFLSLYIFQSPSLFYVCLAVYLSICLSPNLFLSLSQSVSVSAFLKVLLRLDVYFDVRVVLGSCPELSSSSLLLPVFVELRMSHDGHGFALVPQCEGAIA